MSVLDEIAEAAASESSLWEEALLPVHERQRVHTFGALVPEKYRFGVETIYEGYLLHYGRPRLFDPVDADVALLLGDYLYAHGLVRIAATGDVDAVAALAELISTCAALRAEGSSGDGDAWIGCVGRLGGEPGADAVERSLAAHAERVG